MGFFRNDKSARFAKSSNSLSDNLSAIRFLFLLETITMTTAEIVKELKTMGNESYKRTMLRHGVQEPIYGVKIEDMKAKFVKKIKKDYQLALDLYDTGIYDAKYLAG